MSIHEAIIVVLSSDNSNILDYRVTECDNLSDACSILENKLSEYEGVSISSVHYISDIQRMFDLRLSDEDIGTTTVKVFIKIKEKESLSDNTLKRKRYYIRFSRYVDGSEDVSFLYDESFDDINDARANIKEYYKGFLNDIKTDNTRFYQFIGNQNSSTLKYTNKHKEEVVVNHNIIRIEGGREFVL